VAAVPSEFNWAPPPILPIKKTKENTEKTKHMLLSRHQNAGQNHDIKIANRCFENVAECRYLGTTATNQNLIQEEVRDD
jgi:hypothetical protein